VCCRSQFAEESGGSLLETAVGFAVWLMLFCGVIDCSRAVYADIFVGFAAKMATRYAMVRGSSWSGVACAPGTTANCDASSADIATYVQGLSPVGLDRDADLTVTTSWPGTTASGASCSTAMGNNSPGCLVQVTVACSFKSLIPWMPAALLRMSSSSSVTIAQ
jgi:Flp pilus assembly protein TadG